MASIFSAADKLKCVEAELHMREKVYPRWLREGRITHDKAQRGLEVMRAIIADYQAQAENERLL